MSGNTHEATFPCHKCNGKGFLSFCAHIDNGGYFACGGADN